MLLAGVFSETASAQGSEQVVSRALSSYGLDKVEVFFLDDVVFVRYLQQVSEFNTLGEEAVRLAEIAQKVNRHLPSEKNVRIHQVFNDGQIMELIVAPKDALGLLNGRLTTEHFLNKARMKPLTRGFAIVPDICEPNKGKNCQNCEACTCYPNEVCTPTDPRSNKRGCVTRYKPLNAHFVGSEYVCNEGYQWNSDLTECVQAAGGTGTPTTGKPPGSTTWGSLSAGSGGSIIGQAFLLDSIPPTSQSRKNIFSPGERIYLWAESKILNAPHKLEVAWINPSGKEVRRETFDLRGWGARETFWSELQTGRHMEQGQWKVKLLIDGRVDRALYWHLKL